MLVTMCLALPRLRCSNLRVVEMATLDKQSKGPSIATLVHCRTNL